MQPNKLFDELIAETLKIGVNSATVIEADEIITDNRFRKMCEDNFCGVYGKCWMCPPDIGEISVLMAKIREFKYALVYQNVFQLEDSFDVEGMWDAQKQHFNVTQKIRTYFKDININNALCLSAGGCGACDTCAKRENLPCKHPELAVSSLEAYGVDVAALAKSSNMKYINGSNTVTYFGIVLFNY